MIVLAGRQTGSPLSIYSVGEAARSTLSEETVNRPSSGENKV
jgi:hypothetical protein